MSDVELSRRKVHGVLSSKSLLESLNSLTLNKSNVQTQSGKNNHKKHESNNSIVYKVESKNNPYVSVPNCLKISPSGKIAHEKSRYYCISIIYFMFSIHFKRLNQMKILYH